MSESMLDVFREDGFRLGDVAVIEYDRRRVDIYGTNYIHYLYKRSLESRPTDPYGTLPFTYCGLTDLSFDAICAYHANKSLTCPIILLCVYESPSMFTPLGYCFVTEHIKTPNCNSAFAAFSFFREAWGTPEQTVLGMLGLAYLFTHYSLTCVLGQRYSTNGLAARYMRQYGAVDCGTIPHLLRTHTGGLESCTVSALTRVDFEKYVTEQIRTLFVEGIQGGQRQHGPNRSGVD